MTGGGPDGDRTALLERLLGTAVRDIRPAGGQHGVRHFRVRLADGRDAFVKEGRPGTEAVIAAEASGLRWLRAAGAAPVPRVLGTGGTTLATELVSHGGPDRQAAERFGRELAALHTAGADRFGAPWPAFIAGLELPDTPPARTPPDGPPAGIAAAGRSGCRPRQPAGFGEPGHDALAWPQWYAATRLLPFARRAGGTGALGLADVRLVGAVAERIGELAGPSEPPARIHGDCWSGNVLWSGGRGWLIDPAAQGGHRETDLAMLALFGAPHLDRILAAYAESAPLGDGWRARVPLHQLHPLLVHACLFGAGYREPAVAAARAALSG